MDITSFILGSVAGAKSASGLRYLVVEELPQVGQNNIIYLVPKSTSKTNNYYDEYMWISNAWELIGDTQVDLSNYVQNTDYASSSAGGVIKTANGVNTASDGKIYASSLSYSQYGTLSDYTFVSKGTLENVIDGKGLITQYSTMPTASAETVGKIIQYIGTTNANYTNGYFYIGTTDGQDPATYSWENINVQPSSGGGGSTTIVITNTSNNVGSLTIGSDDYDKLLYIWDNKSDTSNIKIVLKLTDYIYIPGFADYDTAYRRITLRFTSYIDNGNLNNFGVNYFGYKDYIITYKNDNGTIWQVQPAVRSMYGIANSSSSILGKSNTQSWTPTGDYNPSTKLYTDKTHYENMTGYDATKTQVLKNINGVLQWITEE